jgi:hypothetical protein
MSDYYKSKEFIFNRIVKRKRNIRNLKLIVFGIWALMIFLIVKSVFIDGFAFFRSKSQQVISIDMLSRDLVEDNPYIKLTDVCFVDNMYILEEKSKETYFYCARTCDSTKYEYNSVIFVLHSEIEKLDTNNLDFKLFSGRMDKGIDVSSSIEGELRRKWNLDDNIENVYTFRAGYHPKDEMIDVLKIVGSALFIIIASAFIGYQVFRTYNSDINVLRIKYYGEYGEHCPI